MPGLETTPMHEVKKIIQYRHFEQLRDHNMSITANEKAKHIAITAAVLLLDFGQTHQQRTNCTV